ncbi:MAG: hypothetical protein K8W52_36325 [Deltaproteobacteria bacterium]|nr:hypothetical protein [Deltaproteobacteria bacterium]
MRRATAWLTGATLALGLAACIQTAAPPVAFSSTWPTRVANFTDVTKAWSRSTKLRNGYEESLVLSATIKTPEWRAARVARDVKYARMSEASATELVAKEQAALADHYEVELLVATWARRENDLERGEKSSWRVVLVADDGTEIKPIEIRRDRRPREQVELEHPDFGDFTVAYIATFPKDRDLFAGKSIRLHMSSARGGVELLWRAR